MAPQRRRLRGVAAALAVAACAAQRPPPAVEYVGGAPRLRIRPGGGDAEAWVGLTFGHVAEVDARGGRVPGRTVASLADAEGVVWTQENRTLGGAVALVTRMELPLEYRADFPEECAGAGLASDLARRASSVGVAGAFEAGGSDTAAAALDSDALLDVRRRLRPAGSVAVETFVFESDAVVEYGDHSMEVARGELKVSVESVGWPFCGADHRLEVGLQVDLPGEGLPASFDEAGGGLGGRPRGRVVQQGVVGLALPTVALVDNSSDASEVAVDGSAVVFRFPFFEDAVLYDFVLGFDRPPVSGPATTSASIASSAASLTSASTSSAVLSSASSTSTSAAPAGAESTSPTGSTTPGDANQRPLSQDTDDTAPKAVSGQWLVLGALRLGVDDPSAFCASAAATSAVRRALARAAGQEPGVVGVACREAGRRLAAPRRAAGVAHLDYNLTVGEGPTAEATLAALVAITRGELTVIINEELKSAGAGIVVEVLEKMGLSAISTGEDGEDGALHSRAGWLGGGCIAAVAILVAHLWGDLRP